MQLVGGDTTRGPLVITVQAHGFVTPGKALRRQGARPGERIYVTGTLGDAGLALRMNDPGDNWLRKRLDFPEPRIEAGLVLRDYASAAIDISDGLLADLGHLLEGDRLGASLRIDALPRSEAFLGAMQVLDPDRRGLFHELPLGAGDDYELCFTVAEKYCGEMEERLAGIPGGCRWIGVVEADQGIRCYRDDGAPYRPARDRVPAFQQYAMTLPGKVSPRLLRHPLGFLAFGFGSGLAPVAPGTAGTLAAVPLYLLLQDLPLAGYLAVVALLFLARPAGVRPCRPSARGA